MPKSNPLNKTWLLKPRYNRVDLVPEGANSQAFIKLFKSRGGNTMGIEEILKEMKPEHAAVVKAAIAKAKTDGMAEEADKVKAAEEAKAETEKKVKQLEEENKVLKAKSTPTGTQGNSEEEILKSVDPAVRAMIEKSRLQAKAAEEAVRKMKDEQDEREAVVKAATFSNIPVEQKEIVTLYKSLKNTDEKLLASMLNVLSAANSVIEKSKTFGEFGSTQDGCNDDAWAQIEKCAVSIAKERNLSKANAITAAISENPELYSAYIKQTK